MVLALDSSGNGFDATYTAVVWSNAFGEFTFPVASTLGDPPAMSSGNGAVLLGSGYVSGGVASRGDGGGACLYILGSDYGSAVGDLDWASDITVELWGYFNAPGIAPLPHYATIISVGFFNIYEITFGTGVITLTMPRKAADTTNGLAYHRTDPGAWPTTKFDAEGWTVGSIAMQSPPVVQTPHHLVIVQDTSRSIIDNMRVYVDGVEQNTFLDNWVGTGSVPVSMFPSPHLLTSSFLVVGGGKQTGANGPAEDSEGFFPGIMDEFALYTSALSPERVAAHYDAGQNIGSASYADEVLTDAPFLYYRLDDL